MKKRLEAELISIAHRVLKLKNKSEINQLYIETRKLYEVLSVLKFVEDNIDIVQPKIDMALVEQNLATLLDQENIEEPKIGFDEQAEDYITVSHVIPTENDAIESKSEVVDLAKTEYIENQNEPIEDKEVDAKIAEGIGEIDFEPIEKPVAFEKVNHPVVQQISFEELLGHQFETPVFDKKEDIVSNLNDKIGKNAIFGLNDKIGFVKHLFDDSEEDFNRVVSQIGTFDTFAEIQNFVDQLVKPDYNDWFGKADYEKRFMFIMQRKFL
ncbi:MAG: hypothetical protein RLZZ312_1447 [Bacteroidota bacterium]|jgi:hypothetical protein